MVWKRRHINRRIRDKLAQRAIERSMLRDKRTNQDEGFGNKRKSLTSWKRSKLATNEEEEQEYFSAPFF